MKYWLMKSEPQVFGIDDLISRPHQTEPWDGVRNYQARNFMRDDMVVGDRAFFYHSSCPSPGITGLVEISKNAYPDKTQFDTSSKYFDPKSTISKPRWFNVEVKFLKKIPLISLDKIRGNSKLSTLQILRRGNRLSITPITKEEWSEILKMCQ
ncbi:MAG: EVE domain-containing protein [Proteobacteria bacterium]|nr:EVE domain-containing protein [Pseudomonadota bacterium]|tara:strand:+ start:1843 stop:2301 length:459 start_codon:yes stop_codon:yes gene_type:complete